MRVVIDAHVLIAAYAARGLCEAVVELCLANDEVWVTRAILDDVRSKLVGKLRVPASHAEEILAFLLDYTHLAEPEEVPSGLCRDPDDHDILGAAQACRADFIISGDQDVLALKAYAGARIVTPRGYWDAFGASASRQAKRRSE